MEACLLQEHVQTCVLGFNGRNKWYQRRWSPVRDYKMPFKISGLTVTTSAQPSYCHDALSLTKPLEWGSLITFLVNSLNKHNQICYTTYHFVHNSFFLLIYMNRNYWKRFQLQVQLRHTHPSLPSETCINPAQLQHSQSLCWRLHLWPSTCLDSQWRS
jgi:hypothetical protein